MKKQPKIKSTLDEQSIKDMVKLGKKYKLSTISFNGITITIPEQKPKITLKEIKQDYIKEKLVPDEDMLFWSTPFFQQDKPLTNGEEQ